MSNPRLRIVTNYGTVYECDELTGNVTRYGEHRWPDTDDSWRFTGAVRLNGTDRPSRAHISLSTLADLPSAEMTFRNGSPRYTLTDYDHGYHRVHGNTRYHGIRYVERIA